jgi:sterol desaturase/sphingolipid hydroxylase (fatty acid hydroxylase superfamily)
MQHLFIVPFYSAWLYMVTSYYDYTRNKELYASKITQYHIENVFWNVFIYQPFMLWTVLLIQPPSLNYDTIFNEILHMVLQIGFGEIWFYTVHYLFHTKYLYKYHKTHHENTEVIGIFALYAHPIDAIILNFGSILLLHYFIRFSVFHIYMIGTIATINTIVNSHTNKNDGFHQEHHRRFTCNYGMNYFMDKLFRTIRDA